MKIFMIKSAADHVGNPRTHASVTETWKFIFPERMKSAGAIHTPMSRGAFFPEIHRQPPEPCGLSIGDLCTIPLVGLVCDTGAQYSDFTLPIMGPYPLEGREYMLMTTPSNRGFRFIVVLDNWSLTRIDTVFPGLSEGLELGRGRVLQRYFEATAFNCEVWVAADPAAFPTLHPRPTIFVVPSNRAWDRIIRTGERGGHWLLPGEAKRPPPATSWQGFHLFEIRAIHEHVQERLRELAP